MNTIKAEINKIIFALTSVGLLILLIFPASLSASHFRYGTMSWALTGNDNATHTEIRLKVKSGWNNASSSYVANFDQVSEQNSGFITIDWGDGSSGEAVVMKNTSVNTTSKSTIAEIGDNSSCNYRICTSGWVSGVTHSYPNNGTYIVQWNSGNRIAGIVNLDNSQRWRNETKVTVGGIHAGNVSPVSAVPPIILVQDNATDNFTYQVIASDANSGDNLVYRWGTTHQFIDNTSDYIYYPPTGMSLSTSGLIKWDVRDSVLADNVVLDNGTTVTNGGKEDAMWLAFIMVEDNGSSGDNKSYVPIDFFFKLADPSNNPPVFTEFPTGVQTVSVGSTKTFTIKSTDYSTSAPTITVEDPPSDNNSIWGDNTTSTSMVNGDNTTTFTIDFSPVSSMADTIYIVPFRSTDNASMTKDQSITIQVSSVANADPTAPSLLSPADGDNVTSPVTLRFAGSTDSDGDNVSYTMYICDDSGFVGSGDCTGKSVTAGGNFVPPFNQNFHDNLIPWPSPLYAATSSQQISQDISMIPKWFIMLVMLGLLSVFISLSVKNIKHRRIVFMLFLIIIGTAVSCMKSSDSSSSDNSTSSSDTTTPDTTTPDTTAPTVSSVSTTSDNQSSVAITDNITVTFSEAMDTTNITTNTSDTYCSVTIMVSSDNFSTCVKMSSSPASSNLNKTFTLDPYDNLTRITTYLTRVTTGVKDTAGNAMSSQYETLSGFTTDNSSISFSNSGLTSGTTYYWKVVASDPKGGSAQSETWSFTVQ